MITVSNVSLSFGGQLLFKDVDLKFTNGNCYGIIGANGAGKTTILHTITGLINAQKGSVWFEGKDITKVPAHKIVSMGMAHVPEGRRVFANLTVLNFGRVLAQGATSDVLNNPEVITAYLGE